MISPKPAASYFEAHDGHLVPYLAEQQARAKDTAEPALAKAERPPQEPSAQTTQKARAPKARHAHSGTRTTTTQSRTKSASRSARSCHQSVGPLHTQAGAVSQRATPARAPTATPCATHATSASSPKESTPSKTDPALTRQTIDGPTSTWAKGVSNSVKHMQATSTTGIASLNLCLGANMSAKAMGQQQAQVRQHIDVELGPVARPIASLHHNSDTTTLPQDILLVAKEHIRQLSRSPNMAQLVW